jgi:hypothetical protein
MRYEWRDMSATKKPGDVISTLSLMLHFEYQASHLEDVREIVQEAETEKGDGFLMEMADGSKMSVIDEVYEGP